MFSVFFVAKYIALYTFYMFYTAKANYPLGAFHGDPMDEWRVGLAFHRQPRTAMERRPYQALQLPP